MTSLVLNADPATQWGLGAGGNKIYVANFPKPNQYIKDR